MAERRYALDGLREYRQLAAALVEARRRAARASAPVEVRRVAGPVVYDVNPGVGLAAPAVIPPRALLTGTATALATPAPAAYPVSAALVGVAETAAWMLRETPLNATAEAYADAEMSTVALAVPSGTATAEATAVADLAPVARPGAQTVTGMASADVAATVGVSGMMAVVTARASVTAAMTNPVQLVRRNSFDGGKAGAEITTANSGGASGDPLSAVQIFAGNTGAYVTAPAYSGGVAAQFVTGASSNVAMAGWDDLDPTPVVFQRVYVRPSAHPAGNVRLLHVATPGNGTFVGGVNLMADGTLRLLDGNNNIIGTGAQVLPAGAWSRIEHRQRSDGTQELRLYKPATSATPAETITGGGVTRANIGTVQLGIRLETNAPAIVYDDWAVSVAGWIGGPPPVAPSAKGAARTYGKAAATVAGSLALRENIFDGGTPGQTITQANSGGASGSPLTLILLPNPAGATLAYSNARAYEDGVSALIATGTATDAALGWSDLPATAVHYGRAYLWLTGTPPAGFVFLLVTDAAGEVIGGMRMTTARKLALHAGPTKVAEMTTAVPVGAWSRVEWRVSNARRITARLYLAPASDTVTEERSGATTAVTALVEQASVGIRHQAGVPGMHFDRLAAASGGWLGA